MTGTGTGSARYSGGKETRLSFGIGVEKPDDKEKSILEVTEWYITCPINRTNELYNSPVYFTEEDVLNGFYIP